jgi:hypothetical protein
MRTFSVPENNVGESTKSDPSMFTFSVSTYKIFEERNRLPWMSTVPMYMRDPRLGHTMVESSMVNLSPTISTSSVRPSTEEPRIVTLPQLKCV